MKTVCYCRCAYDDGISLEIQKEDMNVSRLSRDFVLLDKILHLLEKYHVTLVSIQQPKFSEERQSELLNEVKKLLSSSKRGIMNKKEESCEVLNLS